MAAQEHAIDTVDSAAAPALPSADQTAAYDYHLPVRRIAQTPLAQRDQSRLLHLRPGGAIADTSVARLAELLQPGDLVVANSSRVRAARVITEHGGREVELLVLERRPPAADAYWCLVRPSRHLPPGTVVHCGLGLQATIGDRARDDTGRRTVVFHSDIGVEDAIAMVGAVPLPPYIHQPLADAGRYQTTYAQGPPLSAAAPTAGLHITDSVRTALADRGIGWVTVELTVGLGTFAPMRADSLPEHRMHAEEYAIGDDAVAAISDAQRCGGRIIAVGTTTVRALEASARDHNGRVVAGHGRTDIFITPGFPFALTDGLLTNFHQPRSTLLVLLAAMIGPQWRSAYDHALAGDYRFLSFGDCMLCWR